MRQPPSLDQYNLSTELFMCFVRSGEEETVISSRSLKEIEWGAEDDDVVGEVFGKQNLGCSFPGFYFYLCPLIQLMKFIIKDTWNS